MATAVRVRSRLSEKGLSLFGTGRFGADLTAALAGLPGSSEVAAPESATGTLVAAFWRPSPQLCRHIDTLGVPWLPVIVEGEYIRVGPLIDPPRPPCFDCYYWRRLQHESQRETTLALHAAYDADADCGPVGHLPHHVRLAAGLVQLLLDADGSEEPSVAAIRLPTCQVSRHHVVPRHNCNRCGPALADPDHGLRLAAIARKLTHEQ